MCPPFAGEPQEAAGSRAAALTSSAEMDGVHEDENINAGVS